jgi:signal peptidase II
MSRLLGGGTAVVLVATAVIVFDQFPKTLVRATLAICERPPVVECDRIALPEPLGILRTTNEAGALGILEPGLLALVAIVAGAILALLIRRAASPRLAALAIGLLVGATLSNALDRALFGAVTDFIDIRWGLADRGLVLNPADLALFAGCVAMWRIATSGRPARLAPI